MQRTLLIAVLALIACNKKKETPPTVGNSASGSAPAVASGSAPAGSGSAEGSGSSGSGSAATSAFDPGELKTPESVLYDAGRDMYMVSNINGKPAEADDNGYLTVANPDGSNERSNANWKWIDGSAADIKLDAPKGMAISGDTLYVADITVVRQFQAKAGVQKDDVKIEGATFLNDVFPDGDGGAYVTDSGLTPDFKPSGTDAVWHVTKDGKAKALIKNKDLGGPNGVWSDGKGSVWVVTFRSGEIYEVDAKGKQGKPTKLPKGQLDGIVGGLDGGDFLVSSWEGKCVYRGKPGGEWKEVVSGVESPADIDYDPKRKQVLIPLFNGNAVKVVPL